MRFGPRACPASSAADFLPAAGSWRLLRDRPDATSLGAVAHRTQPGPRRTRRRLPPGPGVQLRQRRAPGPGDEKATGRTRRGGSVASNTSRSLAGLGLFAKALKQHSAQNQVRRGVGVTRPKGVHRGFGVSAEPGANAGCRGDGLAPPVFAFPQLTSLLRSWGNSSSVAKFENKNADR